MVRLCVNPFAMIARSVALYNVLTGNTFFAFTRSPPPSTGRLKALAQSQQQNNNIDCEHNNTLSRNDETPSKLTPSKRSNAHIGGHKFRALLSPEFKNYNAENIDEENIKPGVVVSRALFH